MKKISATLLCLMLTLMIACGQNDKESFDQYKLRKQKEMSDYKYQQQEDLDAFRKKANDDYAAFMKQKWEAFQAFKGTNPPEEPKPPTPPHVEPDSEVSEDSIPFQKLVPLPPIPKPIQPILPEKLPTLPEVSYSIQFDFYNVSYSVKMHPDMKVEMKEVNEEEASRVWLLFCNEKFDITIKNLLDIKTELLLNDWGYIQLVRQFCKAVHGTMIDNASLLQAYILSQSGIDFRLVRAEQHLYVTFPFVEEIYRCPYIQVGETVYYLLDTVVAEAFYVFDKTLSGCTAPTIRISNTPLLDKKPTNNRILTSFRYPEIRISINGNRNLIDYYNDYPLTSNWNYYSQASLSEETKNQVYPALKTKINKLSKEDAANVLIDFVQTAFEYATDDEQFGYERPLFGDETFYYPFSDCEDRSILYSILVHDLLGLNVVLLHFPGHLATAVQFPSEVRGDYLVIDGTKYTICDPTYIGATIGMTMPEFKKEGTEIEVIFTSF